MKQGPENWTYVNKRNMLLIKVNKPRARVLAHLRKEFPKGLFIADPNQDQTILTY